jgi:hypothetical protein
LNREDAISLIHILSHIPKPSPLLPSSPFACRSISLHYKGKLRVSGGNSLVTGTLAGTSGTLHGLLGDLGRLGTAGGLGLGLGGLLVLLLGLGLGDGGLASGGADFGLGGTLGEDGGEVGADDTALCRVSIDCDP